ncbi:hypothetical protein BJ912DRAFT_1045399 [Pholiota molesta]|nr:hypothetical protein BJ912DRAFT_1045399 [Pholiota molesta]
MSEGPGPLVETLVPHLRSQLQYAGRSWAEFDILSLLIPLRTLDDQWNSVRLLSYVCKVFRWFCPRRNSALEDLPAEILVEIFKHMGWRDILAGRQTCKRLHEISTARPLWAFLFNRLSVELMAPPILESPIDTYTGAELERTVLRSISSDIRWTSSQPRVRSIPITLDDLKEFTVLVEGGRWLLLTSSRLVAGCVYAYDLDKSPIPEPLCIIDIGEADPEQLWLMAADVDHNEAQLTFNLCLIPYSTARESSLQYPTGGIHFYRVSLQGHGSDATLMARKLKTLQNGFRAYTSASTLRGHYLARSFDFDDENDPCIEICNWFLSDSSVHWKSYIVGRIPKDLCLLPNNKLIVVLHEGIVLYNIANLHSVPAGEIVNVSTRTIQSYWKHRDTTQARHIHISKPYLHPHGTRLAIAMGGAIYGLTIADRSGEEPKYQLLSSVNACHTLWASIGIDKVYIHWSGGNVETASFIWPDDEYHTKAVPSLLVSTVRYQERNSPNDWSHIPFFDERSCRVFSALRDGSCVVIDYACK